MWKTNKLSFFKNIPLSSCTIKLAMKQFLKKHRILISIIFLALSIRLFFFYILLDLSPFDDENAYTDLALNISNRLAYQNFEGLAYRPPIYPFFLSFFFLLSSNIHFVKLVQISISLLSVPLTFLLSQKIFKNQNISYLSALLVALSPNLSFYPNLLLSETLFTFLLLLSFLLSQTNLNLLSSFSWAITTLTRPITLLFYPLRLFLKHHCFKTTIISLFIFFSTLSVWTLRNYLLFEKFIPFTTNSGVNLLIGNHENATGAYVYPLQYHEQLEKLPEIEKNNKATQLALNYASSHPQHTITNILKKPLHLISPFTDLSTALFADQKNLPPNFSLSLARIISHWQIIHWSFLLLLTFPFFLPSKLKKPNLLVIFILTYTLSLLPFFAFSRFQIPLIPLFSILTAHTLINFSQKLKSS